MDHRNPPNLGSNRPTVIALFIVISSLHLHTSHAVSNQVVRSFVRK